MRLDERLVADGLVESRNLAQRLIMAGSVRVNGHPSDKSSRTVSSEDEVSLDSPAKFVSRGGDKLENAISDLEPTLLELGLSIDGAKALDIGASTGGFTDCLLQRGAQGVVAVDVGYGQLHNKLRTDVRVTILDRTNARFLSVEQLPWRPNLVVCDASFIPLATVLPQPLACMEEPFWGLILCKPQFEAGKERLRAGGSKGVIRDEALRDDIVAETVAALEGLGLQVECHVEARPRGPKGNVEYMILVRSG